MTSCHGSLLTLMQTACATRQSWTLRFYSTVCCAVRKAVARIPPADGLRVKPEGAELGMIEDFSAVENPCGLQHVVVHELVVKSLHRTQPMHDVLINNNMQIPLLSIEKM